MAVLLGVAWCAVVVFYQQQARLADGELAHYRAHVVELQRQLNPAAAWAGKAPPLLRPGHPPRLGGEYYRGNDERNSKLYNGGFYRTCTLRVWLCRTNGTVLAWGDEVDLTQLLVRFEIEPSPGATPSLFTPEIMELTYVSTIPPGDRVSDPQRQIFAYRRDGDRRWIAEVPLDLSPDAAMPHAGRLFVCRGIVPQTGETPADPHYAAAYSLRLNAGRITADSELWMGCLFRTGNVAVLREGQIAEDEWFSFRPIPEIIGEQTTTDPQLLGIEEHRPRTTAAPSAVEGSTASEITPR